VPGGIAGPPCPRAYQYGVLAPQVGGWMTGQQLVTVKKSQLFGNPNFGLGTVRLSGIDLGSGMGKSDMDSNFECTHIVPSSSND